MSTVPMPQQDVVAAAGNSTRGAIVRKLVRWGLLAASVTFILYVVPLRDRCTDQGCDPGILTTLRAADPLFVALAFSAYLVSTLLWSGRWRSLLGLAGVKLTLREIWAVTLESLAAGVLLPGGIGGDALRIAYVRDREPSSSLTKVIASIALDRLIGLATVASLASIVAAITRSSDLGPIFWILPTIPIGTLLGILALRQPAIVRLMTSNVFVMRFAKSLAECVSERGARRAMLRAVAFSFGVSLLQLFFIRALIAAFRCQPTNEAWVYVGSTFGMIVSALPVTPGAWGTTDAAYVVFLSRAGVPASVALALCLIGRLFWYVTGLIGALVALRRRKK